MFRAVYVCLHYMHIECIGCMHVDANTMTCMYLTISKKKLLLISLIKYSFEKSECEVLHDTPKRFPFNRRIWVQGSMIHNILHIAIALELGLRSSGPSVSGHFRLGL